MTESHNEDHGGTGHTTIINQIQRRSNGLGTAGFVIALIALFLSWIPVFGWILWFLGFLFSFIGVFKSPRGLAIAGLVISLVDLILLMIVYAGIFASELYL